MPVQLSSTLYYFESKMGEDYRIHLRIPAKYLRETYGIITGTKVTGILVEVEYLDRTISEADAQDISTLNEALKGLELGLVYVQMSLGSYDRLYLDRETWTKIRDYGIIPYEYGLTLTLKTIVSDEESVEIFSRRDVIVNVQ